MSSQTDAQALEAKIARLEARNARLEAELEVEREQSGKADSQAGSRIKELEQRIKELEIEKRLSTPKPNDRATQREVSADASDPAQRARISQLRGELATKDATIGQLVEAVSFLRNSLSGYAAFNDRTQQGMKAVKQCWDDLMDDCDTARHEIRHVYESTDKFELPLFTIEEDNAMSPLPADTGESSSSVAKLTGDGASGHPQPSPTLTPAKPADVTSEPPRPTSSAQTAAKPTANTDPASTTPSTQNYSQALRRPAQSQASRRGRGAPRTFRPNFTHADFSSKREAEQRGQPESQRQQQSQKPNKALGQGSQRGGEHQVKREDPRPVTGIGSANAERSAEVKASVPTGAPSKVGKDGPGVSEQKSSGLAPKGHDTVFKLVESTPSSRPPRERLNIFADVENGPTIMPMDIIRARNSRSSPGINVPGGLERKSSSPPVKELQSRDSGINKAVSEGSRPTISKPIQPAIPSFVNTAFKQSGEMGAFRKLTTDSNTEVSKGSPSVQSGSLSGPDFKRAHTVEEGGVLVNSPRSPATSDEPKTKPEPLTTAQSSAIEPSFQSAPRQDSGDSSQQKSLLPTPVSQGRNLSIFDPADSMPEGYNPYEGEEVYESEDEDRKTRAKAEDTEKKKATLGSASTPKVTVSSAPDVPTEDWADEPMEEREGKHFYSPVWK